MKRIDIGLIVIFIIVMSSVIFLGIKFLGGLDERMLNRCEFLKIINSGKYGEEIHELDKLQLQCLTEECKDGFEELKQEQIDNRKEFLESDLCERLFTKGVKKE